MYNIKYEYYKTIWKLQKIGFKHLQDKNNNLETQQKELIEWINLYVELLNNRPDLIEEREIDLLKEILSKYKETIGDKDE